MNSSSPSQHDPEAHRITDLLIDRALWGLDEEAERELESAGEPAWAYDRAVGALATTMTEPEPLPEGLRRTLGVAGSAFIAARERPMDASGESRPAQPGSGSENGQRWRPAAPGRTGVGRTSAGAATWLGWVAAAACLVFAWVFTRPDPISNPAERMTRLANEAPDLVRADWVGLDALGAASHSLDCGVGGELVWSDSRNEGYMRIRGVTPNDPGDFQYQLWIFDATRPAGDLPQYAAEGMPDILTQRPVNGGVFDVPTQGEVVVPVNPELPVGEGVIFAVTREPPGGVVVSDRDIVFLAMK